MSKFIHIFLLLLAATAVGCQSFDKNSLQTGDLLFMGKAASELSDAIDAVTNQGEGDHFTHVGMVEIVGDSIYVIHADDKLGVCKQPLDSFLVDDKGRKRHVVAFRLKDEFKGSIEEAVRRVNSVLGQPYNRTYVIEDSGYYCSELIWWAFAPDSVFSLAPMTFKDPETGVFHKGWEEHYQKLGVPIPEGKPGCNPNGMAASRAIFRLGVLRWQDKK
ncbi:YiiX/YebB-like N1pC/P60 family cysteine hydrolase [Thermophagus xiamenensis]|uniref:Permuted papain-like amidase enzyme, YaeF/YiiX, C92 family n=1 Tax=Thermophagus xiamenensis TaxID=385682 RepID=A0A1I1ZZP3_9BACT|nr:YiiX/YebB-like N1pC/P60 family cysteine hydrolase [Thermophagus xiamenensis]SFE37086.1 Permuted papain-like amidase enzyme, YaeF/YiiX, C92 family [Thermophagus xiamenensis]